MNVPVAVTIYFDFILVSKLNILFSLKCLLALSKSHLADYFAVKTFSNIVLKTFLLLFLKFSKEVSRLDPPVVMNPHKMSSRLDKFGFD